MNLGGRFNGPKIVNRYMQATELFQSEDVLVYCEYRERQIEQEIRGIPHSEILSFDKETLFTRLLNSYLSDGSTHYPVLNINKKEKTSDSTPTAVVALFKIPWTGARGYFTFKPAKEYDPPSDEVTIHLDEIDKEITLYYELSLQDPDDDFEKRFQSLLEKDVSWIVNSLDDIIRHFREHETRLKGIMAKALEQRIAAVVSLEGLMQRIEVPEEVFRGKLSVAGNPRSSRERSPRYDVFRPLLFGLQEGRCRGTNLEIYYSESTVDHIIPRDAGGGDELANLQVLCTPCNGLKDNGTQDVYLRKTEKDLSICSGFRS